MVTCRICFALCVRFGASKICGMIYMHGAPPTVRHLAGALSMLQRQEKWQEYVADSLCAIFKALKPKAKIPYYSDFVQNKKEDSRSGQEIVNDIIKRRRRNQRRKEAYTSETI